jgi:hypothetical protein
LTFFVKGIFLASQNFHGEERLILL